ncbi:transcription factor bHLH11-like [Raphanus sativus]|uniref:Transcription factor bHLH11 n=1 Tax=Raphanus sativus TaxID=3726 RepID=A0A6J0N4K2_RAPSA|nr:transcription factor bHLH11 [Raphanus sativus]XP_056863851.1 transcription factor bHLH11-like [Raphanus sativus]
MFDIITRFSILSPWQRPESFRKRVHYFAMETNKKLKISSELSLSDESSASSSIRPEKILEVKKESVSCRNIHKADREKIRRDKLNEQFLELGNALDPNRPKSDKASILIDTIQTLKDLMTQVDRLKAEHVTLSQESCELVQEKSELREEKTSLKSDIEILNAQYQHRVRSMVPWIPHYTYPVVPLVAITQGPVSTLPFPLHGTQNPAPSPNSCSTFMPYSASLSSKTEQKDDVGLELELNIHASSSAQQDVSGKEKKGNLTIPASSSNSYYSSSQAVQDSSLGNLNNIFKS